MPILLLSPLLKACDARVPLLGMGQAGARKAIFKTVLFLVLEARETFHSFCFLL